MKSILLIEHDQETVNQILKDFKNSGYNILVAENGNQAFQIALKNLPQLIICNKRIYDNVDFDSISKLREDTFISTIPFVFLVDKDFAKIKKSDSKNSFDLFIQKPFKSTELNKIISLTLEKHAMLKKRSEQRINEFRESISLALPHEFFTPLNGIIGFTEILSKDLDNLSKAEILEMLNFIYRDAKRLRKLTENFIAYAEIEMLLKDTIKVNEIRKSYFINPNEIITIAACQRAEEMKREKDLILELGSTAMRMSEEYLKKLVEELVDNAFKFSNPGTPVTVRTINENESVVIEISDQGKGMAPEELISIGAYMQFNRRSTEQQGSGLGLAIAKKIAELHGGEIKIQSAIGKGTTVKFLMEL